MVHSEEAYKTAVDASQILFGKGTTELLRQIDEDTFLSVFEGVPRVGLQEKIIDKGVNIIDFLTDFTKIFSSKGEARRFIKGGGLSINKEKLSDEEVIITGEHLINNKYILIQKGKKNYFLVKIIK